MTTFLQGVAEGRIIVIIVCGSGNTDVDNEPNLAPYGSTTTRLGFRESYAMITQKGKTPSWFVEKMNAISEGPTVVEVFIPTGSTAVTTVPPDTIATSVFDTGKETCGLSSFHHFPQTRCPGNTVTLHSDVTLQFCVEACCKDPSCLSFNYNTMSKCKLKNYVCSAEEKEVSSIGNMYDRIVGPDGNIALGKAAFQTSTNWDADGPASRAVDGNTDPDLTNGKSCTHTNGEDNASWWVDLGQAYMVDRVVIYNRMDWGPERLNPFNIHIGDSDQVSANPMCGGNHQIDVTKPSMSVPCPGMRGRYLGVRLPGSNRKLSLCEVKIFPGETPGAMAALTTTQSPPTTLSVSTATTPGQKTAYGCRHEYLQLSCAEGETLWVLDANFGRTSTTHPCSSCNNCPTDCRAASSLSVVRSACQGQRQCSVLAHHSVFGDPCSGINKYLEASYRCITGIGTSRVQHGVFRITPWLRP
ncbi:uncharacterized protein LOC118430094 [Branchiostoma floridae]|uniref:Uncharacterized protein LOC118430094 n=1 Tax=Branchiostoma floridae TaxID=7739 RepID=A0A9J7NA27_BRAFL|nr:uncharacterized protein LOC118430094 [Branchiostoma floridae]